MAPFAKTTTSPKAHCNGKDFLASQGENCPFRSMQTFTEHLAVPLERQIKERQLPGDSLSGQ